jgi:hypothetical protein
MIKYAKFSHPRCKKKMPICLKFRPINSALSAFTPSANKKYGEKMKLLITAFILTLALTALTACGTRTPLTKPADKLEDSFSY